MRTERNKANLEQANTTQVRVHCQNMVRYSEFATQHEVGADFDFLGFSIIELYERSRSDVLKSKEIVNHITQD